MRSTTIIFCITLMAFSNQTDFLTEQKKYAHVRDAIKEKETLIAEKLKNVGLTPGNLNILLVAFKAEDEVLLYVKKKNETTYRNLVTYGVCARSGQPGPKRRQGDYQVPEGYYHINVFNPTSNFFLSLGINYPNLSDKRKSKADDLGGNIFIHGSCVTIGCLPMTDDKIKEIYLYAVHAKKNGQIKIPVYIFPFKMTDQKFNVYKAQYKDDVSLVDFWTNLKGGYDKFQTDKKELKVLVAANGDYIF